MDTKTFRSRIQLVVVGAVFSLTLLVGTDIVSGSDSNHAEPPQISEHEDGFGNG